MNAAEQARAAYKRQQSDLAQSKLEAERKYNAKVAENNEKTLRIAMDALRGWFADTVQWKIVDGKSNLDAPSGYGDGREIVIQPQDGSDFHLMVRTRNPRTVMIHCVTRTASGGYHSWSGPRILSVQELGRILDTAPAKQ